jgi:hypothetical protein
LRSIFWFGFTTWGFPRFRVQYFENTATGNSRFKFRFGLLHIAEYNDTTPDFSRANIIPGRGIRLLGRGPDWTVIDYQTDPVTDVRTATTRLVDTRGTVELTIRASKRPLTLNKTMLAPNKLKFDLGISNFQFQYPTSKIAVLGVMQMKIAYNPKENKGAQSSADSDDSDEVAVGDTTNPDADGGRFAYVRNAWDNIGKKAVAVKSFPLRDDDTDYDTYVGKGGDQGDDDKDDTEARKLVVFVFDRDTAQSTANLLWDPEVAINDNAGGRVAASFTVVLLAVLAAFFGKLF